MEKIDWDLGDITEVVNAKPMMYLLNKLMENRNEIVEWINERDKERIEEYELMRKWIDKIDEWINKHEKDNKLTMQEVIRLWDAGNLKIVKPGGA